MNNGENSAYSCYVCMMDISRQIKFCPTVVFYESINTKGKLPLIVKATSLFVANGGSDNYSIRKNIRNLLTSPPYSG